MATEIKLPRLGQGMETGTIVRWLKSEGETVEKGEPLYELDTEKVTQEVEAESSGVLLKILAGEGDEIEVGKAIAVIGEEGEDIPADSVDSAEAEDPTKVTEDEPAEEGEPGSAREEERERGREGDEPASEPEVSEQREHGGGRGCRARRGGRSASEGAKAMSLLRNRRFLSSGRTAAASRPRRSHAA